MKNNVQMIITDKGTEHLFRIGQPENDEEKIKMYEYRYSIYLKYKLIENNPTKCDIDNYDQNSFYVVACYDDQIIGSLRLICGDTIPTLDCYYQLQLPSILSQTDRKSICEMGRIISTPHFCTNQISSHFVLLSMFYYTTSFGRDKRIDISIGSMKARIVKSLYKLKVPIQTIQKSELIYDPAKEHDPLTLFFDEHKTGKICPVYIIRQEYEQYFAQLFPELHQMKWPDKFPDFQIMK